MRINQRGFSLIEAVIGLSVGAAGLMAGATFLSWMFNFNTSLYNVSGSNIETSLFTQVSQGILVNTVPDSVWLNTQVAQALGAPWQTSSGSSTAVLWNRNMMIQGSDLAPLGTPNFVNDPTGSSDLVVSIQKAPIAPISVAASGGGNQDYVVPAGATSITLNITPPMPAGYQLNDLVGMSSVGGVEFAMLTAIGASSITLDWSALGTFLVQGSLVPLPQTYLNSGMQVFKPVIKVIGREMDTSDAVALYYDPTIGEYNTTFSTHAVCNHLQVFNQAGLPPTTPSLPSAHSGYAVEADFAEHSLVRNPAAAPTNLLNHVKVAW